MLAGMVVGALTPVAAFAQTQDAQAQTRSAGQATTSTAQGAGAQGTVGQTSTDTAAGAETAAEPATQDADIVVTGQRASLETATELKRQSDTIGDSIVLDEANKVPSTSLLEILQRVPGVTENTIRAGAAGSPDGFAFEGSGIQVRGLSGTKSLLNGREIFSANGGAGLSFTDIGPELLKTVTVYKASRGDLIEGGIAGTIDLQTYMPFDFDGPKIAGSVSGNYGDFSGSTQPSASFRASSRFDTPIGEIGILGDIAYSKIKSYDSNILVLPYYPQVFNGRTVYAPVGFSETNDQFERTRKGVYGAVQWKPTDGLTFYHTTFISRWDSIRDTQLLNLTGAPKIGLSADSVFDDDGVFLRGGILNGTNAANGIVLGSSASYTPNYSKTSDFSQGFNFERGRFSISGSYQYTKAISGGSKYALSLNGASPVQTNIDTGETRPALGFQNAVTPSATQSVASNVAWLTSRNDGHQNSWQLDAAYDLGEGFFRKLAVGGRYADRTETDTFVGTYWAATAKGYNGIPAPSVAASPSGDFAVEDFDDFFKGNLQPVASVYVPTSAILRGDQFTRVINTYAACGPDVYFRCPTAGTSNYLYGNPPDPNLGSQPSFVTTKPVTKSAYAMIGFDNSDLSDGDARISGNVGVRWVNYKVASSGNYVFTGNTDYYLTQAAAEASLAQVGGLANVAAYTTANGKLPNVYTTVTSSATRTGSFEKDYFLPSFNVKLEPARNVVVRYALTQTLTPPGYGDIRAQGTASVYTSANPLANGATNTGLPGIFGGYNYTSGNPSLKPQTSINNDVSIEWYPKRGSSFHLALFNKAIKNYILYNKISAQASAFLQASEQPLSTPPGGGAATFNDGPIVANGNINARQKTIISGAEVGARTYLDMFPGLLRGFGIDANATYIDGKSPSALALDMNGAPLSVPLIALSKWSYTTTLLYDLHGVSARLSWSWRSRYLATTSDSSSSGTYTSAVTNQPITFGLPVYGAAAGQLAASIGYQFGKHFNLQANVQNLTNTDQRTELEILPGKFVQRGVFVTDRRFSLSAGFNF